MLEASYVEDARKRLEAERERLKVERERHLDAKSPE